MNTSTRRNVCVLGAGIIGLSTALRLAQDLENINVTVIAEEFSPHTLGDGAGGFWQPFQLGDTDIGKIREWGGSTYKYLCELAMTPQASEAGTYLVHGYDIFHEQIEDPPWHDILMGYRHMEPKELTKYPGYRFGFAWLSVMAEGKNYIPWLTKRCQDVGIQFVQKKVADLSEVSDCDLVVNCTGLGARELVGDESVTPIQGQLIMVKAPWMKHFLNADEDNLHMLLGRDWLVLGGTHNHGVWSTTPDPVESQRIWTGMCRLEPALQNAQWSHEWCGLRPGRPAVRLELEKYTLKDNGKYLNVIHNYGHGGAGFTLHWGCAKEVVDVAANIICKNTPASRL